MEERIIDLLKSLKNQNEISGTNYDNVYSSGFKLGILYGLNKIHKTSEDGIPPFRSIFSAIGTPTYKLELTCSLFCKLVMIFWSNRIK